MYVPWSVEDAVDKLEFLLEAPHVNQGKISDWNNGTIDRCIDIMEGTGNQWLRSGADYRKHTRGFKY
jgi:hypothetical protein